MFLPLELTLRPSRVYRAILVTAHGLALAGLWTAALPAASKAAMALFLFASVVWTWREVSAGPQGLRVSLSGQIEIFDGEWQPATLKNRPVILPGFVSLALIVEEGKSRRLALLPDSTEPSEFRKLRVWLKWAEPGK